MIAATNYDVPANDVVEISLFGPQFGEGMAIHYGDGKWITVDSCLDADGMPAALKYLQSLGLSVADVVTHTVITHPDGDHVAGISTLFGACSSSQLVCSAVLCKKDVINYLQLRSTDAGPSSRSLDALEVIDVLKGATKRGPMYVPMFLLQDRPLVTGPTAKITALSPSDAKLAGFLQHITQRYNRLKGDRVSLNLPSPNAVSIALIVEGKQFTAILGADLEEVPGRGWHTILTHSLAFRGARPSCILKVPHHGSANAYSANLWNGLVDPIVILAPFHFGRHELPSKSDVSRMLGHTSKGFSTSPLTRSFKRTSRADKVMSNHGVRRADLFTMAGHIRVRIDSQGQSKLDLFNGAVHLSKVH